MFFRSCCFSANLVIGFVTLFGLMVLIDKLPGLKFSASVLLILPLLIASMIEGKVFARQKQSRPPAKDCWIASFKMMAIVSLIVCGVVLARIILNSDSLAHLAAIELRSLGLAISASSLLAWLLLHLGYAIGLASELKGQHTSHQN